MRNTNTSNLYRSLLTLLQPSQSPTDYNNTAIIDLIDQLNETHREYLNTVTNLSQFIRQPTTETIVRDISGNDMRRSVVDISGNGIQSTTDSQRVLGPTGPTSTTNSNTSESFTLSDMMRVSNSLESQIHSLFGTNIPIDITFLDSTGSTRLSNGIGGTSSINNSNDHIQRYTRTTRYTQVDSGSDSDTDSENICPITRTEFREGDEIMEICACHHKFKKNALTSWLRTHNTCPVCRVSIN